MKTFVHRPWFKVAINSVLRAVQRCDRPVLLASIFETDRNGNPTKLVGYKFSRVYLKRSA